jgi:preprotein translocase subunit SecA
VREAGGLAIIGTERHESRRVDRQLRGRAGRQGDPGSSQFFVSLEDDLMRMFGSERISKLMDRMGIEEGEVIQHSMITKSIERAQKKVEENNFGTRKRLLEYDDVMNSQREVIYSKRKHALFGDRLSIDINNMLYDVSESLVTEYVEQRNFEGFKLDLIRFLSIESPVEESEFFSAKPEEVSQKVFDAVTAHYKHKSQTIAAKAFPIIKQVYEEQGATIENIAVPFSDGMRGIQVSANLKKAFDTQGRELITAFERGISLALIDDVWKEHLRELDDLKQSVQNAVYEQKDPLIIYKFESFDLFRQMLDRVNKDIISFLMKGAIPIEQPGQVKQAQRPQRTDMSRLSAGRDSRAPIGTSSGGGQLSEAQSRSIAGQQEQRVQPVRVEQKIGRNDPCPCGSGKKYKNCHGKGTV